jgi:membrane-bound lytic murein transglycosylase F
MRLLNNLSVLLCYLLFLAMFGCEQASDNSHQSPDSTTELSEVADHSKQANTFEIKSKALVAENRRWNDISKKGVIRAGGILGDFEESSLHQKSGVIFHRQLIEQFAKQHQLMVEWYNFSSLSLLLEALHKGKIDIVARDLTITIKRGKSFQFTMPIKVDYEQVVMRKGAVFNPESVLNISLPSGSAFLETVKAQFPHWTISELQTAHNADDIVEKISNGDIEASLLDASAVNHLKKFRNDFSVVYQLKKENEMAWAIRKKSPVFTQQLNEFIQEHLLKANNQQVRFADLKSLKSQKLPLRLITRNSAESYYMWKGERRGFDYELIEKFADQQGLDLEVVVAASIDEMEQLLSDGYGDIIGSAYTETEQRADKFLLSRRYALVDQLLISHKDNAIPSLPGLKEKQLSVKQNSAFWSSALELEKRYGAILDKVSARLSTESILEAVALENKSFTIADSHLFKIMKMQYPELHKNQIVKSGDKLTFAMRKESTQLKTAINKFVRKEYKSVFYNVTKKKYFYHAKKQKVLNKYRLEAGKDISPYDAIVKKYAAKYGLDWRIIVAQMYQESRFKPNARSNAGAIGLMQILPRTGKELGFNDLKKPQNSIEAGIQYMQWTADRFKHSTQIGERLYFALAAYNAGFGHIRDAQKLAKKQGWRSDLWFGHVEKAVLLLQKRKYYQQSKHGYCRGWEPVKYVREIKERYLQYIKVT